MVAAAAGICSLGSTSQLGSFALRHLSGSHSAFRSKRYPTNGPGWSQAQVKRMARKRRNQARHRASNKRTGR